MSRLVAPSFSLANSFVQMLHVKCSLLIKLGQTNLISGSTDPTDPVFAENRKKKQPKNFYVHVKIVN